jgi:hypothetical protein
MLQSASDGGLLVVKQSKFRGPEVLNGFYRIVPSTKDHRRVLLGGGYSPLPPFAKSRVRKIAVGSEITRKSSSRLAGH